MASDKQYRAPAGNDEALVDPSWPEQLSQLQTPPKRPSLEIAGVSLEALWRSARSELLAKATEYTSAYADVPNTAAGPLVISGHQPELFHPGVWFKNFALDSLAKRSGGVGIHLLIDSDTCREKSIRVPTGSTDEPRQAAVLFDKPSATIPYEERRVQDDSTFGSFADRVRETIQPLVADPLIQSLWPHAIEAQQRTNKLGQSVSEARHRLERSWGSGTLELPFSQVADTPGFRRLVAELILRSRETADAYNQALADYRVEHNVRNAAQPLPDLQIDSEGVEVPFWIWSTDDPTRRALFVSQSSGALTLTDRHDCTIDGPTDTDGVVAWLAELRRKGFKIRSRALVTTLYCRLVLADLFLHGIGGAKYDQVTDRFCENLLGVTPRRHATLSATLRLPIEHDAPTDDDRRALKRRLRNLTYHPENFLTEDSSQAAHEAAQQKADWIAKRQATDRAKRHEQIVTANQQMHAALASEREQAERELAQVKEDRRNAMVLNSREYSFCLFPADSIRQWLSRLSQIDGAHPK